MKVEFQLLSPFPRFDVFILFSISVMRDAYRKNPNFKDDRLLFSFQLAYAVDPHTERNTPRIIVHLGERYWTTTRALY